MKRINYNWIYSVELALFPGTRPASCCLQCGYCKQLELGEGLETMLVWNSLAGVAVRIVGRGGSEGWGWACR